MNVYCQLYWTYENKEKEAGNGPFKETKVATLFRLTCCCCCIARAGFSFGCAMSAFTAPRLTIIAAKNLRLDDKKCLTLTFCGQWLWHSWQSGCWRQKVTQVQDQSLTGNPIKHEFRYGTGNIDEKALNGPFFKERFNNLLHWFLQINYNWLSKFDMLLYGTVSVQLMWSFYIQKGNFKWFLFENSCLRIL